MTLKEAVDIAQTTASQEGWKLAGPVRVVATRRWPLLGPVEWQVVARVAQEGKKGWVRIDPRRWEIIASGWRRAEAA